MKRIFIGIAAALLLTSCNGGGGDPPPAPVLNWSVLSVKSFFFSWADVPGETKYRLLEDPDGVSGYTPVATISADAINYRMNAVALIHRINARYILQACNGNKCSDSMPVFVAGNLAAAAGYVKASNTGPGDFFGYSVALSGDGQTLAVGARDEDSSLTGVNGSPDNNSADNSGAVYVFSRGGGWNLQAYLKSSNTGAGDFFGISMALSGDGNTLAVGAVFEDSNATGVNGDQSDNSVANSGAAYVFTRNGNTWSQQAYLKASTTGASDLFGNSVALSDDGNVLAVGDYNEDSNATGMNGNQSDNSVSNSGAVHVFMRSGSTWSPQAYMKASNPGANDLFGNTLALSEDGTTLAVGAVHESSNTTGVNSPQGDDSAANSGAVYVFTRNGGTWSQQAYVKASNTAAGDTFGECVALSRDGNTLAVGAINEDSNTTGVNGGQGDNSASSSGAVYVFTRSGAIWSQQAYVKASNTETFDRFGASVALSGSGTTLAVGAYSEDSNATGMNGNQSDNSATDSGAVYVFTSSGGVWSQRAYVKAPNTEADDIFGYHVALAGDDSTLAVVARDEDSGATGVNGSQNSNTAADSGAAYLY